MQIRTFAGSTRLESLNRKIASPAAATAPAAGAIVAQLELAELNIPMHAADHEAQATPPDVIELKAHVQSPGLAGLLARVQRQLHGPAKKHHRLGRCRPVGSLSTFLPLQAQLVFSPAH